MGNCERTKATLAEVQQQLLKILCESANTLADPPLPIPDKPTSDDLHKILENASRKAFKDQYNYEFKGAQSKPPGITTDVIGSEGLCNITNPEDNQISKYVNILLGGTGIKSSWVKDSACADLVTEGQNLFSLKTGNSWNKTTFLKTYESPDTKENSVKTQAALLFCNASLTVDDNTDKYSLIYYVGVFYEVVTESTVKSKLLGILIDRAKDLMKPSDLPLSVTGEPNDVQQLEGIVASYGKKRFLADYGFEYQVDATKPPDINKYGEIHGYDALCYIESDVVGEKRNDVLANYVDTKILSKMSLPLWAAAQARTALLHQITTVLELSTGNSWTQAPFTSTLDSGIYDENSVKTASVQVYTKASLTEAGFTVNMTLIHYTGVYYGITSPQLIATDHLRADLYSMANKLLEKPRVPKTVPPSSQDLAEVLDLFTRDKFGAMFMFPYKQSDTLPPDITDKKRLQNNELFFDYEGKQDDALERYINGIFSGMIIPSWGKVSARADLLSLLKDLSQQGKETAWKWAKYTQEYPNSVNPQGNGLKTCALVAFSNSRVARNGKIYMLTLLYYVGIYYPIGPDDWSRKNSAKSPGGRMVIVF